MRNEAQTGFKEAEVCRRGELSACIAQQHLLLSTHPVPYSFCHPCARPLFPSPPSAHPHRPPFPASPPTRPHTYLPGPRGAPQSLATPLPAACPQASASPQRSLASFPCTVCKKKSPARRSQRAAAAQPLPELQAALLGVPWLPSPRSLALSAPLPATPAPRFGAARCHQCHQPQRGCLKWLF